MTDNEIIKANECCGINCLECPLNETGKCATLTQETLDLINRQKAEIERFKKIETTINAFWCELQKLSIAKEKETPTLEELLEYIEQAKSEAIKEFAYSYTESFITIFNLNYSQAETARELKERIVKEMEGETE